MPTDALYYPWIDPPNQATLVNAVLYWDHVHTIVPASMDQPFSNRWSQAAEEFGFLKRRLVHPDCPEVRATGREITRDLERDAILHDVSEVRKEGLRWGAKGYRIHLEKVSSRIHPANLPEPIRSRVWKTQNPDREGFYRMDPGYAAAYMARE